MTGDRTIQLYRSNQTEVLADRLAQLLVEPVGGPLEPEWLVVQGRGMAVWLAMELARRHGVCAGIDFLYPKSLAARLFEMALPESEAVDTDAWSGERLTWSVMSALGDLSTDPALAPLTRYLEGDEACRRRYPLARQLADQLDQYVTYRPEMIRAWDRGVDEVALRHGEPWQPVIWRRIVERLGPGHAAALEQRLLERLMGEGSLEGIPGRLVVFGLVSLPPMYLRVLAALARHVEVHWLMPSPASGYWADLVGARTLAATLAEGRSPESLHLEQGHPLLVSCGGLAADTIDVMTRELEALGVAEREPAGDLHQPVVGDSVLHRLQNDILAGRPGDHRGQPSDDSVTIHACHGPMREVEVLRDQLLARLTGPDAVRPHEVLVMMADVDTYAPLVEAVFTRDPSDPRFIPFSIADRAPRQDSPVVDAFQRLLTVIGGRAKASELLDLLALGPIRRRFDLAPEDLDRLRDWLREGGVRWGIDASHRAAHGQPAVDENTWRFGLERLLLGYAMPTSGRALFAGRLPYDEVEGQDAALLGRAVAFAEKMFHLIRDLAEPRSPAAWRAELVAALDDLIEVEPDQSDQEQLIREAIGAMAEAAEAAEFQESIDAEVVRRLLTFQLDDREPARGFLRGGVTFCAMVPMRSIPFRVIAMLGMGDGAFPRHRRPQEHDLLAKPGERRPGDRSRREDDRYLFLEAVLAARDQLVITYPGQSVRDNSPLPPSVVVSELIDELITSYGGAAGASDDESAIAAAHPLLLTRHPLQPFSPRYFDGSSPQLFSYDQALRDGARALARPEREAARPLFDAPLEAAEDQDTIDLGELVRFFENPVRHILKSRLGVDLGERATMVGDREPVELDHLERYQLGDVLLGLRLDGVEGARLERLARASGLLAPGTPGQIDHRDVMATVEPLAERVRALREGGRRADVQVSMTLADETRLTGTLGDLWAEGLVIHQFARVSGKQVVGLWLRHLALCGATVREAAPRSYLVGRAPSTAKEAAVETVALRTVAEPSAVFADLVALYRIGQREPLALFPKSADLLVKLRREGKKDATVWSRVVQLWTSQERAWDPHVARAFPADGGVITEPGDRLARDFAALAERVFSPIYDHLVEGGDA